MATPATVEDYVAALPPPARDVLQAARTILRREVPGVEESIRYQIPCFAAGGTYLVHVAAWKSHIGLYPVPRFRSEVETQVASLRHGQDTVRLPIKEPFAHATLDLLLSEIVALRLDGRTP
ncbi:MAG: iron chaperone [Ornithinimicrobium sp.]|jgi:uncharacterized protein YdhG (YjbR/CyaY superfamily)|uniref:iron chaperone n=1 Tax=Ornithinimicrobium sp. TaxID=1977084 RepID=UPI003D9BBC00